jgi:hypothetical protein
MTILKPSFSHVIHTNSVRTSQKILCLRYNAILGSSRCLLLRAIRNTHIYALWTECSFSMLKHVVHENLWDLN